MNVEQVERADLERLGDGYELLVRTAAGERVHAAMVTDDGALTAACGRRLRSRWTQLVLLGEVDCAHCRRELHAA